MNALFFAAPLAAGFVLDLIAGDPPGIPHIVRFFGALISALEKLFRRLSEESSTDYMDKSNDDRGTTVYGFLWGLLFCASVVLVSVGIPAVLILWAYLLHPIVGVVLETLLIYQLIAVKDLRVESMRVFYELKNGKLPEARRALSMIVGRDTERLDEDGVTRAAVETVAENASDGAASPLFYIALGGAAAGCLYKAVNTMDSMVGYKNERYLYFGRAAARLDDALNFIPSRLCALLMVVVAAPLGFDAKGAARIWRRDGRKHASPNSAQTEAACAGALDLRLAGPAFYEGRLEQKPFIGDDTRPIEAEDIVRANKLHYGASILMFILAMGVRICCMVAIFTVN
jgi:adenosylcobinamide-phosphate synthase